MKKLLSNLVLLSSLASASSSFAADCKVQGTAYIPNLPDNSNGLISESGPAFGAWDLTTTEDYPGSMYNSQSGVVNGNGLVFSGPANHTAIMFGNYRSWQNISKIGIFSYVEFSTKWQPSGREVCTNHKTKSNGSRVCTAKAIQYDNTSFDIELTQNGGVTFYKKTFLNVNQFSNGIIYLPNIECTGDLSSFGIRIREVTGGTVDFTIHNVHIDARWNLAI